VAPLIPSHWWELSPADASAFRDHVVRRANARLIDLAHQMAETGGPVEAMDASVESLDPLWAWFVRLADDDFPGTPQDAAASPVRFFRRTGISVRTLRGGYAAEALEHYLFEVIRTYSADVKWEVARGETTSAVIDPDQNRTVVVSTAVPFYSAQENLSRAKSLVLKGDIRARQSDWLTRQLSAHLRKPESAPSASAFVDRVRQPLVPLDDLVRQPPVLGAGVSLPQVSSPAPRSIVLTLTPVGSRLGDNPATTLALNERRMARLLDRLGFRRSGRPIAPDELREDSLQILDNERGVLLETYGAAGRLRALTVEPLGGELETWTKLELALRKYAARNNLIIEDAPS
jgi:hypothetical protein